MKRFCVAITLGILCISVILSSPFMLSAQQTESWPMFHGDLAHTGNSNSNGPTSNQTLWVYRAKDVVWSSPAVVNGVVYFGSFDKNVYAVNAKDGTKIWSFSTGGNIFPSPAVANNIVYIGSDDHNIYALNDQNGALVWNFTTGAQA